MDLDILISRLQKERADLNEVIVSLEELRSHVAAHKDRVKKRRGRKMMGAEERLQVGERMRKYWASRRLQRQTKGIAESAQPDKPALQRYPV